MKTWASHESLHCTLLKLFNAKYFITEHSINPYFRELEVLKCMKKIKISFNPTPESDWEDFYFLLVLHPAVFKQN